MLQQLSETKTITSAIYGAFRGEDLSGLLNVSGGSQGKVSLYILNKVSRNFQAKRRGKNILVYGVRVCLCGELGQNGT